jgi:hypothetical protein
MQTEAAPTQAPDMHAANGYTLDTATGASAGVSILSRNGYIAAFIHRWPMTDEAMLFIGRACEEYLTKGPLSADRRQSLSFANQPHRRSL